MIESYSLDKGTLRVNYSLERSSLYPGPEQVHRVLTPEEMSELPLYHGHCAASKTGPYAWVWYEDIVVSDRGGVRFEFNVTEMSDDFYEENVTMFRFEGEPCDGEVVTVTMGRYNTPPSRNRVWQNPVKG